MSQRIIEVVDYDSRWPELFAEEQKLLAHTLGAVVRKIHHIGSTSVEGLSAKPIIDILLEVASVAELDQLNNQMVSIGYLPKGEFGIPRRRYFQKGDVIRTHQLHAYGIGDSELVRHLAFRDYLVRNQNIADEYGRLKKEVAASCDNDIDRYCDGKDAFIKEHEAKALQALAATRPMN